MLQHATARRAGLLASLLLLLAVAGGARGQEPETVELVPDDAAGFGIRNIVGLIRRGHYHGDRRLHVETTPPHATLDLFYIRAGFQKLYEQAEAPAVVELPKRVEAGPRDNVVIRAYLEGYRHQSVTVPVHSDQSEVLIELEPLPNRLEAIAHVHFAGRTSLAFLLAEPPTVRVQNRDEGFHVILAETARAEDLDAAIAVNGPTIHAIEAQQLGEDLLVEVALADGASPDAYQLRSRQSHDPIRRLHRYVIDLAPANGAAEAVEAARQALARLRTADVTGCNEVFDKALRERLDPETLARALTPRGEFTDRYLRAALRRLGEISPGGVIRLLDGTEYRPDIPLELGAAAAQAGSVRGYLALLRAFVAELEPEPYRAETLRGLVAPEMDPQRFREALAAAEAEEARCQRDSG